MRESRRSGGRAAVTDFGPDDERYARGVAFFNAGEFYDAHEVWESLWHEPLGEAADFVQGLIQYATALHHFRHKNLKGTRLLYEGGVELLKPYEPVYWRLPVADLTAAMTRCVAGVLAHPLAALPGRYHPEKESFPVKMESALVPTIRLLPEPARG